MSSCIWASSLRQRLFSICMATLVFMGYRRWLSRPWQWSLRNYMVVVAVCAAGLVLYGFPTHIIIFFTTAIGAICICLRLARYGYKLVDVATLLTLVLLATAIMLPSMEQTRRRTLGKQFFRSLIPGRYVALFSDSR